MLSCNQVMNAQRCVQSDDVFGYKIACPICSKRVLDVSEMSTSSIIKIRLKCPHCRTIVKIPIFVST
jgi:phage FluMu protein Com